MLFDAVFGLGVSLKWWELARYAFGVYYPEWEPIALTLIPFSLLRGMSCLVGSARSRKRRVMTRVHEQGVTR